MRQRRSVAINRIGNISPPNLDSAVMHKKLTLAAIILSLCLTAAFAKTPVEPVNKSKTGLAVKGYDVVAYFEQSEPHKGSTEFTFTWMSATWQFSSAKNRDLFMAGPEKYAPQFGGYCAWAVGHAYTADADPEAWKIVDGKLYLNYNKDVQKKWSTETTKWIEDGKKNWPGLHK